MSIRAIQCPKHGGNLVMGDKRVCPECDRENPKGKREFQVGEKIKFVGPVAGENSNYFYSRGNTAIIKKLYPEQPSEEHPLREIEIEILEDTGFKLKGKISIHPRQVTHRIRKKEKRKPREFWIGVSSEPGLMSVVYFKDPRGYLQTETHKELILVREVLDGKGNTP